MRQLVGPREAQISTTAYVEVQKLVCVRAEDMPPFWGCIFDTSCWSSGQLVSSKSSCEFKHGLGSSEATQSYPKLDAPD